MKKIIIDCLKNTTTRFDFWIKFCKMKKIKEMAELGVYKGEFASALFEECNSIEKYYLVDTWCHRENWNKPLNHNDKIFKNIYLEAKRSTNFVKNKRIILRGKTNEMHLKSQIVDWTLFILMVTIHLEVLLLILYVGLQK